MSKHATEPVEHFVIAEVLLAQRRFDGDPCKNGATLERAVTHALMAADPVISARMMMSDVFQPLRTSFRYRLATVPGAERAAERLEKTSWVQRDTAGPGSRLLHLEASQSALLSHVAPARGRTPWQDSYAKWHLNDGAVLLTKDDDPSFRERYALNEAQATLTDADGVVFVDIVSECDH